MSQGKETSLELRNLVVKLKCEKKSYAEIAKIVKKSRSTVQTIYRNFVKRGNVLSKSRCGRPRKLDDREARAILRKVKKNPKISAPKLADEIATASGKKVHPENVRRILRSSGYNGRVPRRKPFISSVNQQKRLAFASAHIDKDFEFWKTVVFTDESKFNVFGSDGRGKVWRKKNTEMNPENLTPTVKHGGGSVMVWGAMAAAGVGNLVFIPGTMDRFGYLKILQGNLLESVRKLGLGGNFVFQHDNDPKHTAKIVKEWLLYRTPKQLHSPPQSPDLNPIEHLWEEVDRKIRQQSITSVETLKKAIQLAWSKISSETTKNLVNSMPNRMHAVIASKGGPTKY